MTDQPSSKEPPSKEELMARLQDLHARAVDLRDRAEAQARAQRPGPKWGLIALLFGLPIAAGVLATMALDSILLGVLAGVVVFVALVVMLSRNAPASTRPGTRAWEARLTAELLDRVIAQRTEEQAATQNEQKRARFDREIAFLEEQRAENHAIWASEDPAPGKGYVGFTPYSGS